MEEKTPKTLYLVKTRSFRAYVIAENTDIAITRFTKWLRDNSYGFINDRLFESIEVVASEDAAYPLSKSGRMMASDGDDKLFL